MRKRKRGSTITLAAKLATLGDCLRVNIIGQDEVIGDVESLLRGSLCNLRFPGQPTSMLFLGATGVGKTETVLLFTEHLFGSTEEKLVRLDMSEFMNSNIGARMAMESRSTDRETLVRRTSQAATQDLRPETFGRFDLECVFNKLDCLTVNRIGELHLTNCLGSLIVRDIRSNADPVCSSTFNARGTPKNMASVQCAKRPCGFCAMS